MKILYLCLDLGIPVLAHKGGSVHVRGLVGALGRAGHSVVLAASALEQSPWHERARLDASLLHLPPDPSTVAPVLALKAFGETLGARTSLPGEVRRILYNEQARTELKRRFEHHPPDLIYERASLYGIAGGAIARELNVPRIVELNAPIALEQSVYRATGLGELAARAERWTLGSADAVLVVSSALRDYVASLGVDPARIHVVPNGVDASLFRPGPPDAAIRARWGLDGGPVLGFVGGLRPWHGVEALPALLDRLDGRHPGLRLVVAGDGPMRGDLERDLRRRGAGDRVVLTGSLPHEEIGAVIRQFDVALAPYPRLDHAFYFSPLKLFEYMACGVPVVAPAVAQIAEVVRDGETGLLYPAGDLDGLAAACDRLLGDAALREGLGRAAAQAVHDRYTWDHNAARVAEVARGLISGDR